MFATHSWRNLWWLGSVVVYLILGTVARHHTWEWQLAFVVLFVLYVWGTRQALSHHTPWQWLGIALLMRLVLLFHAPVLSDDFYRFLWDGWLWHQGLSPFSHTPQIYADKIPLTEYAMQCLKNMNSPNYMSPYPLLHQLIFFLSSWETLGIQGSLLVMRLLHLSIEMLLGWVLICLLNTWQLGTWRSVLYLWNPLVVLEGVGNLHSESYVLLTLLMALYALQRQHALGTAAAISLGAAIKLLPVLFVPYLFCCFLRYPNKAWRFAAYIVVFCALLFVPLIFVDGMRASEGVALYGEVFAFNASLYTLGTSLGLWSQAWILMTVGLVLIVSASIFFSTRNTNPATVLVILYGIYFLCASTVHPWYILPMVGLALLSKAPLVTLVATQAWSYLILWSYAGYTSTGYVHDAVLLVASYGILVIIVGFCCVRVPDRAVPDRH